MSFTVEHTENGVDLIVTGEWTPEIRDALESRVADGLVLNHARGFHPQPIDFIHGLPIRRLNILARSIDDLSPVYSLKVLEELRVQSDPRAVIELERLPFLKTLAAAWPQISGSIMFARNLQSLSVPSYSEFDLTPLASLNGLIELTMKVRPKLHSRDGIEGFPWLAHLGIYMASNLEDIAALQRVASPILETLQPPACKKVTDVSLLSACHALRFFNLSDGGEVPTVRALESLEHVERLYLYGSTMISDGDLSPIMNLPRLRDFRMKNRRGYSPSVQEIQESISNFGTP